MSTVALTPDQEVQRDWPEWAAALRPRVHRARIELFAEFVGWMRTNAAPLWEGQSGYAISNEEHQAQRESLAKAVARDVRDEGLCADWWDRLISIGNSLQRWVIPYLPPVVRMPPIRPMVVRRDFLLLQAYREIEQLFWEAVRGGVVVEHLSTMLMCSAVVCGGVSSAEMLAAIGHIDSTAVREFKGVLRVALRVRGRRADRIQWWYPDAQTSVLLVRCLRTGLLPIIPQALNSREALLVHLQECLSKLGATLVPAFDLLRATYVSHSFQLPRLCVEYLAGELQTTSLPEPVLKRLCSWNQTPLNAVDASVHSETNQARAELLQTAHVYDPRAEPKAQQKFISRILNVLLKDPDPLGEIRTTVDDSKSSLWPITYFLGLWICWRLGERVIKNDPASAIKAVKGSSARRYLSTFARHLIVVAETENLLEMEVEDWESLFELAAERVKGANEQAFYWSCIKSFSTYMTFYGAPEITLEELDGYTAAVDATVSANLVGEKEFQTFKAAMLGTGPVYQSADTLELVSSEQGQDQDRQYLDTPKVQVFLAAVLGYRCGLRRREVQMLWAHDVFPSDQAVLNVRASSLATLKSRSAYRRIPLGALVPADELKILLDYLDRRKKQLNEHKALLFSRIDLPQVPLSDQFLFRPITEAFQRIRGIDGLPFRFHHLRHSFANWLLLALLAADNSALLDSTDPLVASGPLDLKRVAAIKSALFPRMLGAGPAATRKNLYLVSALLGHLSPETSLRHYIHLLDWLAGREVEIALATTLVGSSPKDLGIGCGLSASMPYKAPYVTLLENPVAFMRQYVRQYCPSELREVPLGQMPPVDLTDIVRGIGIAPPPGPSRMMLMLRRMLQHAPQEGWKRGAVAVDAAVSSKLERDHSVSHIVLQALLENYLKLYAKQSMQVAKSNLEMPAPPRTEVDSVEFWRVLDTASSAFSSQSKRESLILAAEFLVERNGPRVGNVYFGKRWAVAPSVVDGLIAMGLDPGMLTLDFRVADMGAERTHELEGIAQQIGKRGVSLETKDLDWEKRQSTGATMRLRITPRKDAMSDAKLSRMVGRIRGLNYAALWVLFASALVSKG